LATRGRPRRRSRGARTRARQCQSLRRTPAPCWHPPKPIRHPRTSLARSDSASLEFRIAPAESLPGRTAADRGLPRVRSAVAVQQQATHSTRPLTSTKALRWLETVAKRSADFISPAQLVDRASSHAAARMRASARLHMRALRVAYDKSGESAELAGRLAAVRSLCRPGPSRMSCQ